MARTRRSKERKERRRASARDRAEKRSAGFGSNTISVPDGMNIFSLDKEGSKRVEIVEYEVGEGNPYADAGLMHYERTYFIHRNIGPNEDWVVCPAKTAGKKCPICEHRSTLDNRDEADNETIKSLTPKERQLFLVYDHDAPDKGIQIWDISYHLFGKALDAEIKNADDEEVDSYEAFASLDEGMSLKLSVSEGSMPGSTFYQVDTVSFKPRRGTLPDELAGQVVCLDELPKVKDYDELKNLFLQIDSGEDDEDDEDQEEEKPTKPSRRGKRKSSTTSSKTSKPSTRGRKKKPPFEEGDDVKVTQEDEDEWEGVVVSLPSEGYAMVEDDDGEEWEVALDDLTKLEDESEEEPPKEEEKPKRKPRSKAASTTKTKSTKSKSSKAKVVEEDDDDDDDDWDDDDWDDDDE